MSAPRPAATDLYPPAKMLADANELEDSLTSAVGAHVHADNAYAEARAALKEAERLSEEEEGWLRSEQTSWYEASKLPNGKVAEGQYVTGSNEATRTQQLKTYLAMIAAKPASPYGKALQAVKRAERALLDAEKMQAETKARLTALYAVMALRTALINALAPLNASRAQLQMLKEGVDYQTQLQRNP